MHEVYGNSVYFRGGNIRKRYNVSDIFLRPPKIIIGSGQPACAHFEGFPKTVVLLFFQSTSCLKGVFPFAAWKWKSKQEMRMVLQGEVKAGGSC